MSQPEEEKFEDCDEKVPENDPAHANPNPEEKSKSRK